MLAPKRMKFRKQMKGRNRGIAEKGASLDFGNYGLMAVQRGRITSRQIEAARIAMTRKIKRGGQVWIKIFPHKPVTKKPAEVRMGSGKGAVDRYEAVIKPGRILYEMGGGIEPEVAKEALMLAASKLPIKTRLLVAGQDPWAEKIVEKLVIAKQSAAPAAAAAPAASAKAAPAKAAPAKAAPAKK